MSDDNLMINIFLKIAFNVHHLFLLESETLGFCAFNAGLIFNEWNYGNFWLGLKFRNEMFCHVAGEDTVARELKEKVRVLCWVMTGPSNHQKKARHVKRTWGKRCKILIFMSSEEGNLNYKYVFY